MTAKRTAISAADREALRKEIWFWRQEHLDKRLEQIVEEARRYHVELQRHDQGHAGRLQQRRDRLMDSIRSAREHMPDWPITDQDIESQLLGRELAKRADELAKDISRRCR